MHSGSQCRAALGLGGAGRERPSEAHGGRWRPSGAPGGRRTPSGALGGRRKLWDALGGRRRPSGAVGLRRPLEALGGCRSPLEGPRRRPPDPAADTSSALSPPSVAFEFLPAQLGSGGGGVEPPPKNPPPCASSAAPPPPSLLHSGPHLVRLVVLHLRPLSSRCCSFSVSPSSSTSASSPFLSSSPCSSSFALLLGFLRCPSCSSTVVQVPPLVASALLDGKQQQLQQKQLNP